MQTLYYSRRLKACSSSLASFIASSGAKSLGGVALAQQQTTLTSTVPQSGFSGDTTGPPGVPLTGAQPYTFDAQEVQDCPSIESISVTLTLEDGDSAMGERDFNDLTLGLDGIDTGILLNGFPDAQTVTFTIPGTPNNAADILAALRADNQLAGTIIDANPGDNPFLVIPAVSDATLEITCATAPPPPPPPPPLAQQQQSAAPCRSPRKSSRKPRAARSIWTLRSASSGVEAKTGRAGPLLEARPFFCCSGRNGVVSDVLFLTWTKELRNSMV